LKYIVKEIDKFFATVLIIKLLIIYTIDNIYFNADDDNFNDDYNDNNVVIIVIVT
jgi:hypothetical protein